MKPKISIACIKKGTDNCFGQAFSAGLNDRPSLFGASEHTESTAADSMLSNSLVGSLGKASFVDFNISIGRRTSIAKNMQIRRRTEVDEPHLRPSDGSLNDRSSTVEEGNVNEIQPSISTGKCYSDVKYEESKDQVPLKVLKQTSFETIEEQRCDSHRSNNSGRLHNGIRSFVNCNNETDGFD